MSLVIVETTADQPITDDYLHAADQQMLPCLNARNIFWNYSFLSSDRRRMICTFNAPDAGSVRESYQRAGLSSRLIWAGDLIEPDAPPQHQVKTLQIMEGTYPSLSKEDWLTIRRKIAHGCLVHNIEWRRSYLSLDRTRLMCELNAPNPALVQEALNQAGVAYGQIWSAQLLKP